jgi:cyclopropane fatty-acyl-phospholipid synthase-like methyltransferase
MSRRPGPPERLVWAVDSLEVQAGDRILEIGCGRGVAAELICDRLEAGRLLALDRSAKAIEAATARNAEAVAAGKAEFITASLEDVDPAVLGRYDKILAINVNLFWVRPARHELRLLTELLRPGGRLWLFYDPPAAAQLARLRDTLSEHLDQAGYSCTMASGTTARSALLAVTAWPTGPANQ